MRPAMCGCGDGRTAATGEEAEASIHDQLLVHNEIVHRAVDAVHLVRAGHADPRTEDRRECQ